MNEQQLQQILTIQQAIAAAATAAVINSLLNPQQAAAAANLTNQNALNDSPSADNESHDQHLSDSRQGSPMTSGSPSGNNQIDTNNRTLQDLLIQLQQQANANGSGVPTNQMPNVAQAAAALNFNLNNQINAQPNPTGSPISRLLGQNDFNAAALAAMAAATTSGNIPQHPPSQSPNLNFNKKPKRHHQPQVSPQPFPNQHNSRSSIEATSKPLQQHSLPKSHSATPNIAARNSSSGNNSSPTSSTFLPNNVGLPRKLVRGQDVWLGRGAEQTRQILKCMWCGQSFRTLAEMTQHMKVTQHYTNIISQEQITSWKQPDSNELTPSRQPNKQSINAKSLDDPHDTSSERLNDSDRDDSFSNDDEPPQRSKTKSRPSNANKSVDRSKIKRESTLITESKDSTQRNTSAKSTTRARKRPRDDDDEISNAIENSNSNAAEDQEKFKNCSESNDEAESDIVVKTGSNSPKDGSKIATDDEQDNDSKTSKTCVDESEGLKQEDLIPENDDNASQGNDQEDVNDSKIETSADEPGGGEHEKNCDHGSDDDMQDQSLNNVDECDRTKKKTHSQDELINIVATTGGKQVPDGQKGDGTGDPLSALETMVEKSFDPRMRPGMASGGILQRLGIDEEVMPPWQHINYANWYAAAAYGHPMAAALFAAGMNLQNGIKLSKNMNPKKSDE